MFHCFQSMKIVLVQQKCERKNWYHLSAYFSNIAIAIFEFTLFSQKKVITFSLFASFWYQFFASFFIALSFAALTTNSDMFSFTLKSKIVINCDNLKKKKPSITNQALHINHDKVSV